MVASDKVESQDKLLRIESENNSREREKLYKTDNTERSKIGKDVNSLKPGQAQWQKTSGEVIPAIRNLADAAAEAYQAYLEYPLNDNFKDHDKSRETAANKRDFQMSLVNQAKALYCLDALKYLDKLQITNKQEFKEAQQFLDLFQAKMSEKADLDRAAKDFEKQGGLPKLFESLQNTLTRLKRMGGGTQKDFANNELQTALNNLERHQRETGAKIQMSIRQAKKIFQAYDEVEKISKDVAKIKEDVNDIINTNNKGAIDVAGATSLGTSTYKDIADKMLKIAKEKEQVASIREARLDIEAARDQIEAAENIFEAAGKEVEKAKNQLEEARNDAKASNDRFNEIRKNSIISGKINENTKRAIEEAEKFAKEKQTKLEEAEKNVKVAETKLREADQIKKEAQAKLEKAQQDAKEVEKKVDEAEKKAIEAKQVANKDEKAKEKAEKAERFAKAMARVREKEEIENIRNLRQKADKAEQELAKAKTEVQAEEIIKAKEEAKAKQTQFEEAEKNVREMRAELGKLQQPEQKGANTQGNATEAEQEPTKEKLKKVKQEVRQAEAELKKVKQEVRQAEAELKKAEQEVRQAEAELKKTEQEAQQNLEKSTKKAEEARKLAEEAQEEIGRQAVEARLKALKAREDDKQGNGAINVEEAERAVERAERLAKAVGLSITVNKNNAPNDVNASQNVKISISREISNPGEESKTVLVSQVNIQGYSLKKVSDAINLYNTKEKNKDVILEHDNEHDNEVKEIIKKAEERAKEAEKIAKEAGERAQKAEERAKEAGERARKAGIRAKVANKLGEMDNKNIYDGAKMEAERAAKYAKNIKQSEEKIANSSHIIEKRSKDVSNKIISITDKIKQMQDIIYDIGEKVPSEQQKKDLERLAKEIEGEEKIKNNAASSEKQAFNEEQSLQKNVTDLLEKESKSLKSEIDHSKGLNIIHDIEKLETFAKKQKVYSKNIEEYINNIKENPNQDQSKILGYGSFKNASEDFMEIATVLKRIAIHREQEAAADAEQAIERLDKIKDNLAKQDEQQRESHTKGHLFIDPDVGRTTINGVWTSIREINGWDFSKQGQTSIELRPDIVKIDVLKVTRETQKIHSENVYTKRLKDWTFQSESFEYSFQIPGDLFNNRGRRQGVLLIVDRGKKGGIIPKPKELQEKTGSATWTEDEWTTRREIDMEAAATIQISENHNSQNRPVEVLFSAVTETLPAEVINHDAAQRIRQGPGWSDENKQHMWRFDLDRRMLVLPNGLEFPMEHFDWTETKYEDREAGLSLQFKGPKELSQVNLKAVSAASFDPKLRKATDDLKMKKRKQLEESINWLKQSIQYNDEKKIREAIESIRTHDGLESYHSSMTKNELEKPPKNRIQLEELRKNKKEQEKEQRDTSTPAWMAHAAENAGGMLRARQGYESEMKRQIRATHEKHPLSAREKPEKHSGPQGKEELLNAIHAAEHLDKVIPFQLLTDPKQGANLEVKLNGFELLREYRLHKNQQEFADEEEKKNVTDYIENIAREFRTNPDIHYYYTNQWNLQQAIDAASDGKFAGKEKDGEYIPGAIDYIHQLKQGDLPSNPNENLASLRQADEYHWVKYLHDALHAEANAEGVAETLKQALPVAKWMQESRNSNLELAKKALDPGTSSADANKFLQDMHAAEIPSLGLKGDEKPAEVGKDAKRDGQTNAESDGKVDLKGITTEIMKKTPEQLIVEAGGLAAEIYQNAVKTVERAIESTSDPYLQKRYREVGPEMIKKLMKETLEINKQDKNIQNQWHKLEEFKKQMDEQRWKDVWTYYFLLYMKNSVEGTSKGAQKFLDEFLKVVGKIV